MGVCVCVLFLLTMASGIMVSRRNRQQLGDTMGSILRLVVAIFVNGVMTILWPVVAPIMLAVQLWNSLPSFRQVCRAVPTRLSDIPTPRRVWNSIPSVCQVVNAIVNAVRAQFNDYMAHMNPAALGSISAAPPTRAF